MQQISLATLLDFAGKINAVHEAVPGKKAILPQDAIAGKSGTKARPDCEQAGRAYHEVYFLDFLIPFSYEEIDGEHFLIVRAYEKIGKIDEKV